MQSVSSRIWTRVVVSISYDDNHYTTGTSNPISSEEKNDIKRAIYWQRSRSKEDRRHQLTRISCSEREREREWAKLETTHHPNWFSFSPLWRKRLTRNSPNTPLFSALVTSDWLRVYKSNNPTTINYRTFSYFLIPYQHVFTNPVIWTFYLFVSNTIVKIFTCLRVLCFCNCVYFFPCNRTLI